MSKRRGDKRKDEARSAKTAPLHPLDVAALNRAFYASDPADYFHRRINELVRLFAHSDAELRQTPQEHKVGGLSARVPSVEEDPADEKAHQNFALIEAEMTVHHLGETLLRMYLAHAQQPDAPWVAVTRLRGLGEFKRHLKQVMQPKDPAKLRKDIAWVFLGHADPPEGWPEKRRGQWAEGAERIEEYLRHLADLLLERAPVYNAAKHGLATHAGMTGLSLEGVPELSADGPSIAYLGTQEEDDGQQHTVVKTRWVNTTQDIVLAITGAHMLSTLWMMARMRYVDWPMPSKGFAPFIPPASVRDLLQSAASEQERDKVIHLGAVSFPPAFHTPPGAGTDALIAELKQSEPDGPESQGSAERV